MKKLWLIVAVIFLVGLAGIGFVIGTQAGLNWVYRVATSPVPGSLEIQTLEGRLIGPVDFKNLNYKNSEVEVIVGSGHIDWQPGALFKWALKFKVVNLNDVIIKVDSTTKTDSKSLDKLPDIVLPIDIDIQSSAIKNVKLFVPQEIDIKTINLKAATQRSRLSIQSLSLISDKLNINLSGNVTAKADYPLEFNSQWQFRPQSIEPLAGETIVKGSLTKLRLQQTLSGAARANATAEIKNILSEISWDVAINLEQLDPNKLQPDMPSALVKGEIQTTGSLASYSVQANLSGSSIKLKNKSTALPAVTLASKIKGSRTEVQLESFRVAAPKGWIEATGRIGFDPVLTWNLDVKAADVDPANFWGEWPGKLNMLAQLEGKRTAKALTNRVDLTKLEGQLRGYPVLAQGRVLQNNNNFILENISASSGSAHVNVAGDIKEQWALQWSTKSSDLKTVLPDAAGSLNAQGAITGPRNNPRVEIKLAAENLAIAGVRAKLLSGDADVSSAAGGNINIQLNASDLLIADHAWQRFDFQVKGSLESHTVDTTLANSAENIELQVHAGVTKNNAWQGRLQKADFLVAPMGQWQLADAGAFNYEVGKVRIDPLCWSQSNSKFCISSEQKPGAWSGSLEASELPLAYLKSWLPADTDLNGFANAKLQAQYTKNNQLYANGEITTSSAGIEFLADKQMRRLDLQQSVLRIDIDHTGLRSMTNIAIKDTGTINGKFDMPGWSLKSGLHPNQLIKGDLDFAMKEIAVLGIFTSDVDNAKGNFDGQLAIAGSIGKPNFHGTAKLRNGSADIPRLGLHLENITMDIKEVTPDTLGFNVAAKSGDGEVRIEGKTKLDLKQGWPTQLTINGEDFKVVDIPESMVTVSPQLEIESSDNLIKIEGKINVPRARLEPRDLPKGSAKVSPDVVIIQNLDESQENTGSRWRTRTRIRVVLGDRVRFDGFGLRGKLTGDLLVVDEPEKLTVGRGTIAIVEGFYKAYGQDLTMERGKLIFTDSVIDDPGVDVRATRKINEVIAGVRVSGTLKEPELALFSEPQMSESDMLSYLLLGRPMTSASSDEGNMLMIAAGSMGLAKGEELAKGIGGVLGIEEVRIDSSAGLEDASLVVGRYLSPKLYIRYVTGIFSVSNIVQLQYQLNKKLQAQTETGDRTGADLFYTFER